MPWSASERQTFPSDPERLSMRMVNSLVMGMPGTSLRAMNGRRDESPSCRMAMRLNVVGDGILRLGHGGCKGRSNGTLSRGRRTTEPWRDPSSMDESLRLGLGFPPMHCAKPSPGGRAKSLRGENIRKNWVYTPAGWKSQLVIRRKSLYHGITNLDLSPAERWGAVERPALKLERVQ
jgi:hypothetical protein